MLTNIVYDELHNLHVSPNSVVKSKRMKMVRNVACVGKLEVHSKFYSETLK
jgi:hypothetical protein